ncbi:peptidase M16 [Paenibacillus oryzae]|uniref:Peptidase M16 n=1 Tax=Paenibacillus oryzae TaxID=1844972 RepID=A0A1A5YD55_9BACL|nr:insulinase family protein [Paenibacillus oryzae]OBR63507.1 peptidase M16 [Paenibacillus oryzae]
MIDQLQPYRLLQEEDIKELQSSGYLLEHKKSGAKIVVLSNKDDNKVFSISFRTPPSDHTGVAHILEHSVLCGSRKFPAKDSFVELLKGSLNTFLNALTFSDKTVYPIASRNDKDFQNLMDVYLDAVLHPAIYDREETFLQEGWHYELQSEEGEITYNGVVYNEMKGVFSSAEDVVYKKTLNSLFPDTTYGNVSGGLPEHITDLTYQELLDFHTRYYHPSNSYIYLYGDMDVEQKLLWLDEAYLSDFDRGISVDSSIALQPPPPEHADIVVPYSAGSSEPEVDNSFLTYSAVIGTSLEQELSIAFKILQYALLDAPGAVLTQALLDKGIAGDVYGSFNDSMYQPVFTVTLKQSNLSSKETFLTTMNDVLKEIVKNGFDKKALLAGLNSQEFRHREADYGNMPKGLIYNFNALKSWLYDENAPFTYLQANEVYNRLRQKVDEGYFEQLVERYLLNNNHVSFVAGIPDHGLGERKEKELQDRLKALKESLNQEQLAEMVQKTIQLKAYQNEPSTREQQDCIPLLSKSDIKPQAPALHMKVKEADGIPLLHHSLYSNGIGYLKLLFDVKETPRHLLPYLGLLQHVLSFVDTKNYAFSELANEINLNSGGMAVRLKAFNHANDPSVYSAVLEFDIKVMYDKLGFAFSIIEEIIQTSNLDDSKRLLELVSQLKGQLQSSLISGGHVAGVRRSSAGHSPSAAFREETGGIAFYHWLEALHANFASRKEELSAGLKELMAFVFQPENLLVSYTSDENSYEGIEGLITSFARSLNSQKIEQKVPAFIPIQKREGIKTSSEVQYVVQTGNFRENGYSYTGALRVLEGILSLDYLWNQIRAKGGAYGCMAGFQRNGDSYFASYRDPNLEQSYKVYEEVPSYLRKFKADEQEMTRYIIGAIQKLDMPKTPRSEGEFALACYLSGVTEADLQQERDEVLAATAEDISGFAALTEKLLEQGHRCVIGNEHKIGQAAALFDSTLNLIQSHVTDGE